MKTNNQTVIVQGTVIEGKISSSEDIRIEGEFKGDLDSTGAVHIASEGKAEGNLKAASIHVEGHFNGEAKASEQFRILPSGNVQSDIHAPSINIEKGAKYSGKMEVASDDSGPAPAKDHSDKLEEKQPPKPETASEIDKAAPFKPSPGAGAPFTPDKK